MNGVKQIEAAIFDADGTILDTRELIIEAYRHILESHDYPMPPLNELAVFGGRPTHETYAHFAPGHDGTELSKKHTEFQMTHLDLFAAYEGIEEMMAALKTAGLKIGLCTNRKKNVIELLKHIDLHKYFDEIVYSDIMSAYKPQPDGIFLTCEKLGVEPAKSVMIGDNEADIGAAKAAGCAFSIGITHGTRTREALEQAGADYIVDHLSEIMPLIT